MLKTIKGKVIAGTVSVALLSSAGVAFGASDAGLNLKAWYDGQFGATQTSMETEMGTYVGGKIATSTREYMAIRTAATGAISAKGSSETDRAGSAISEKAQEHINAVNTKKDQISAKMEAQFNELLRLAKVEINETGNTYLGIANNDLIAVTGTAGSTALAALEEDLGETKSTAITNLEDAINNAKTDLQDELLSEKNITTGEINAAIDAKVTSVLEKIAAEKVKLVKAQEQLISAKSAELEALAKEELQAIVDGINAPVVEVTVTSDGI